MKKKLSPELIKILKKSLAKDLKDLEKNIDTKGWDDLKKIKFVMNYKVENRKSKKKN